MKGGRRQPSHVRFGFDGFDQPIGQTVLERGDDLHRALAGLEGSGIEIDNGIVCDEWRRPVSKECGRVETL